MTRVLEFPENLQSPNGGKSRFGVFKNLGAEETKISKSYPQPRYFLKESDQISLGDGTKIVICNQWVPKNIKRFIDWSSDRGIEIKLLN